MNVGLIATVISARRLPSLLRTRVKRGKELRVVEEPLKRRRVFREDRSRGRHRRGFRCPADCRAGPWRRPRGRNSSPIFAISSASVVASCPRIETVLVVERSGEQLEERAVALLVELDPGEVADERGGRAESFSASDRIRCQHSHAVLSASMLNSQKRRNDPCSSADRTSAGTLP